MRTFYGTLSIFRSHARAFLFAMALAIVAALADLAVPQALRELGNGTLASENLAGILGILVCAQLASSGARIGQRLTVGRAAGAIESELTSRAFRVILARPFDWHETQKPGEIAPRLERGARAVAELGKVAIQDVLGPIVALGTNFWLFFDTHAAAALVGALAGLVHVALGCTQVRWQSGVRVNLEARRRQLPSLIVDALLRIETVKLFRAQPFESGRFSALANAVSWEEYRHSRAMGIVDAAKVLVERVGLLGILWAAWNSTPGALLTAILLYERLLEPVRVFHRVLDHAAERWAQAEAFFELIGYHEPANTPKPDRARTSQPAGHAAISVRELSYRGPDGTWLFQNVSFQIPEGARVAVEGPNGAGKSTLIRLLSGLIRADSGEILVSGELVGPIETARAFSAVLPQRVDLIPGLSVRDNVEYGLCEPLETRRLAEIVQLAGIRHLIGDEAGIERCLSPNATNLSGGELQRIAIARVLARDQPVIFLDEPSSALDPQQRRKFFDEVLIRGLRGKTIVAITHDADVGWADLVLRIEGGTVLDVTAQRRQPVRAREAA